MTVGTMLTDSLEAFNYEPVCHKLAANYAVQSLMRPCEMSSQRTLHAAPFRLAATISYILCGADKTTQHCTTTNQPR